jgi:hypothetical protein
MTIIPDLLWYIQAGKDKGITGRCPFATVESCPRYYQSLSLLGEAGSTKIAPHEDARLLAYWQASDLWPRTGEYATSVSGPAGDPHQFSNFCPEVAFDRFGYFATFLARYADEIDAGVAHTQLSKEHAPGKDWRWSWAAVSPEHYADCSLYSVLTHRSSTVTHSPSRAELPWWRKHLVELIVGLLVTVIGGLLLKLFG